MRRRNAATVSPVSLQRNTLSGVGPQPAQMEARTNPNGFVRLVSELSLTTVFVAQDAQVYVRAKGAVSASSRGSSLAGREFGMGGSFVLIGFFELIRFDLVFHGGLATEIL